MLGLCVVAIVVIARLLRNAHRSGALFTDVDFMRTFGGLYLRYKRRCYFWEVVILVRKLVLTLVMRLVPDTWAQLGGCFVIFGISLALQQTSR